MPFVFEVISGGDDCHHWTKYYTPGTGKVKLRTAQKTRARRNVFSPLPRRGDEKVGGLPENRPPTDHDLFTRSNTERAMLDQLASLSFCWSSRIFVR